MSATSVTIDSKPRVRGRVRGSNWTWVPIVFLAYSLLYDNSTSTPSAAGASWTQFLELPREIRIVEAVCVLITVLVLLDRTLSKFSRKLLLAVVAFSALAVASHITHPLVSLIDVFRLTYAYILPLLIFVIGREARLNARSRKLIWRFVLGWVILNAVVSWYQFAWLGYPVGDDITGLNKDAHANGNLMFFTSLMFVASALFQRRKKLIFGAIALVVTAILSSVLKSLVFSFFGFMLIVWVNISSQATSTGRKMKAGFRKRLVPITAAVVLLIVGGFAFSDIDRNSSARVGDVFTKLSANPLNFGPIAAHVASLGVVATSGKTFLVGNGPYSYANPISVGQGLGAGQLAKFAQSSLLPQAFESGESTKITLTSCVLAELGFPAFVILVWAYLAIGLAVWRARQSTDPEQVAFATGLTGWWLILILTALMSMFGSLDIISISWPVMFLAGMTCRIGSGETELSRRQPGTAPR
jgi:hypothetical protein